MQHCFDDWGQAVGQADTGTAVCSRADPHNSSITQGQQVARTVEPRGARTDCALGLKQ